VSGGSSIWTFVLGASLALVIVQVSIAGSLTSGSLSMDILVLIGVETRCWFANELDLFCLNALFAKKEIKKSEKKNTKSFLQKINLKPVKFNSLHYFTALI
jgi:hypothetical protein